MMLGTADEVQTAWLGQLESAGEEHGVALRDMLSTASGCKVSTSLEAMRTVGETIAADVYEHLLDPDAQVEGNTVEDIAEEVDLCRFGQELSCAQLFGPAGDFLVERMRKRKCVYNADAMRRKRLAKLRVGDIEVEVRASVSLCLHARCTTCVRAGTMLSMRGVGGVCACARGQQHCHPSGPTLLPHSNQHHWRGASMQVTTEGLNAILMHRKAALQRFSVAVQRPPTLRMADWVCSAGGDVFDGILRHIREGGRGLEHMLQYLRLGAILTPWCVFATWWHHGP